MSSREEPGKVTLKDGVHALALRAMPGQLNHSTMLVLEQCSQHSALGKGRSGRRYVVSSVFHNAFRFKL
jgi:hypothetical protein